MTSLIVLLTLLPYPSLLAPQYPSYPQYPAYSSYYPQSYSSPQTFSYPTYSQTYPQSYPQSYPPTSLSTLPTRDRVDRTASQPTNPASLLSNKPPPSSAPPTTIAPTRTQSSTTC